MKSKLLHTDGTQRTFAVIGDPDDDAIEMLDKFAREQTLSAAQLTAVGAFSHATVGWFDRHAKAYRHIDVGEQCEVLSLVGDIALDDHEVPVTHAHAVLGLSDGQVRGGHLLAGAVWPTLEVIIRETPAHLRKTSRPDIGIALIDLSRS